MTFAKTACSIATSNVPWHKRNKLPCLQMVNRSDSKNSINEIEKYRLTQTKVKIDSTYSKSEYQVEVIESPSPSTLATYIVHLKKPHDRDFSELQDLQSWHQSFAHGDRNREPESIPGSFISKCGHRVCGKNDSKAGKSNRIV
ncbi:unnamed protein product [Prunus armeniaca]|uniref:Uncharacterized protein n=1 Tax=Prunus armeniaca TaxID=36596 RepID=A0A6J5UT83_PRUAR|nr:unnamed protein product [Prunus armeniaca]CAB4310201.1 unnamed protein product [Prunus armeniaca]